LIWSILVNFETQVAATCYTSSDKLERLKSFDITMILLALNIKIIETY
jgi:hypothetical protein